jgi:succinate dehydrogenase/fumarate reductase flavoprotein subunit
MSNFPTHPLTIKGTNIHMPVELLDSGGLLRKSNGDDASFSDAVDETCVLDLRELDSDSKIWFSNILSTIKNRTGLNIDVDVIPISCSIITTGGIPIDYKSRATFNDGKMWFTGLYAAGRSANTGMHGAGLLPGNILLEDLFTGERAGAAASTWALNEEFNNSELIQIEQSNVRKEIQDLYLNDGKSVGQISSTVSSLISKIENNYNEKTLNSVNQNLSEINKNGISLTDKSKVMNTELLMAVQIKGLLTILTQIASN